MSKKHKLDGDDAALVKKSVNEEAETVRHISRRMSARAESGNNSVLSSVPFKRKVDSSDRAADRPKKSGQKKRTDSGKSKHAAKNIKRCRSVETLFRNAYRAQLDMLSLAATKANIMISLNGLLMSILVISGTHFIEINGLFVIPIAVFLTSCAIATSFAAISARPEISRRQFTRSDFESDEARLLVFEEFSDLDEREYRDSMVRMLGNRQRIYCNMIAHVHELGTTADRKYRQLYYSYTVFIVGVVLTVLTLLTLMGLKWLGLLSFV